MATERPLRPLTTVTEPALASDTEFTFAVMGDGRPTLPRMPYPQLSLRAMREIALLRPAFVLYTGDAIWGFDDTRQEFLNELDRFRAFADTAGVPLYNVPGNHEMQSRPEMIALLEEWGQDLYGSFDVGRYHFVALNTDEFCKEGRVCDEQLDWLRADLELNRDAAGIFVFMHRPVFSSFQGDFNPDDGEILHELFRTHPVRAVFASHDHFYSEEVHDDVRYVTAGGAGAPMYAQPQRGGFAHYILVAVGGQEIDYDVIEPGHVEVHYVAGNDGLEPIATARVANTTDRDLVIRNLQLRVPRLSACDHYRIRTACVDWERKDVDVPVTLHNVTDMGDGSVTVRVEVPVPTGTAFYVSAEAREPAA
jgi:hypothetical protein